MKFDAMAAAIDWFDCYRAADIESILKMYSDTAVVICGCDGVAVEGRAGLRAYWEHRLREYPGSHLDDLKPTENGAIIAYVTHDRVVSAILEFDANGRIAVQRCSPLA